MNNSSYNIIRTDQKLKKKLYTLLIQSYYDVPICHQRSWPNIQQAHNETASFPKTYLVSHVCFQLRFFCSFFNLEAVILLPA